MIAFPISPKEFIRYQEQLVGRALSEKEKEITADWAEIFNLVYEDGLSQDHTTLYEDLSLLDKIAACFRDEPGIEKFSKACRTWIIEAWKQGAERSRHEKSLDH